MPKFARPNAYNGSQSNTHLTGSVRSANAIEAAAGISDQLYISPLTLAQTVPFLIPDATTTVRGGVFLATTIEAQAATNDTDAMTPLKVAELLATPPEIGGTIPGDATFETLSIAILEMQSGAVTDLCGTATLIAGTVTIANTAIQTNDLIFLSLKSRETSIQIGTLSYTISNGVSFTVNSIIADSPDTIQLDDFSTFNYFILRPF